MRPPQTSQDVAGSVVVAGHTVRRESFFTVFHCSHSVLDGCGELGGQVKSCNAFGGRRLACSRKGFSGPPESFCMPLTACQVPTERRHKLQRQPSVGAVERPAQRRAHIVELGLELGRDDGCSPLLVEGTKRQCERQQLLGKAVGRGLCLAALLELLSSVLSERLQHHVAAVPVLEQAFVHQYLEGSETGVANLFGRFEAAAADEDSKSSKQTLLVLGEEGVTPVDRGAKSPLSFGQISPAACEEGQSLLEPPQQLLR